MKLLTRRAAAYVELHDMQHAQVDYQEVCQDSCSITLHVRCMSSKFFQYPLTLQGQQSNQFCPVKIQSYPLPLRNKLALLTQEVLDRIIALPINQVAQAELIAYLFWLHQQYEHNVD